MIGVLHALCNAHHLHERKVLVEIEKEDWARKMQRLLRRASHATNFARERSVPLNPRLIALIERFYDTALTEAMTFHEGQPPLTQTERRGRQPRRVGHNLPVQLSPRKQDVLRFLADPSVPFINNLAERDGRMLEPQRADPDCSRRCPVAFPPRIVPRISPSSARFSRPPASRAGICFRPRPPNRRA
jgi:transposase